MFAVILCAFLAALNVFFYILTDSPWSAASALFCGLMMLVNLALTVDRR